MRKLLIRLFRPCDYHSLSKVVHFVEYPGAEPFGHAYTCGRCGFVQDALEGCDWPGRAIFVKPGN